MCGYKSKSSTSLCCYGYGKLFVLPSFRDIFALQWTCSRKGHGGLPELCETIYYFVMLNWIFGHFELFRMWLVEQLSSYTVCILIIICYYWYVNLNDLSYVIIGMLIWTICRSRFTSPLRKGNHALKAVFSELLKQLEYSQGSWVVSPLFDNTCELFYGICTIVATLWLFHLVSVLKWLKGTLKLDWWARIWIKWWQNVRYSTEVKIWQPD